MRRLILFLIIALYPAVTLCPATAVAWPAKVLSVQDGDTITVAPGGDTRTPVTVRLYGIDAPELGQKGGPESAEYLKQLCPVGKKVEVIAYSTDKYGRTVALVVKKDKVINADMLEQGHAWIYKQFCKQTFCRKWRGIVKKAKAQHKGLWLEEQPIAPWEWRHSDENRN